jgi:hypothetical protein
MPHLLSEKNTKKLFLLNFAHDIAVRHCFALTFILLNGILVYDIFNDSNHSKDIILIVYLGINLCFLAIWSFACILARKLAPYIQVEGKIIKFCHCDFFDHWNNNTFELNEIDNIKIINKCNPYNSIALEQIVYVVLKDNNCIQVHDTLSGTTRRQSSFVRTLEKMTGKSVAVITEVRQIC